MKKALVLADRELQAKGYVCSDVFKNEVHYEYVGNIHDELQTEANDDIAEVVGETVQNAIKQAGVELGMRCPLDAEYKIGSNWKETH
nr:hypothetical protein 16 [Deltaproteobacteria bacterium]